MDTSVRPLIITTAPTSARSPTTRSERRRFRRTGIRQSKLGCDTCRYRKVKCDEHLPYCNKCAKGGRVCTWERRNAVALRIPLTPVTDHPSPSGTAATSRISSFNNPTLLQFPVTPERADAQFPTDLWVDAARLIAFRTFTDDFPVLYDVLHGTLFRYDHLLPSTTAAAEALVAAMEHLTNGDPVRSSPIASRTYSAYGSVVSQFRSELPLATEVRTSGPLTCVFLTCLELILRRRQDAMSHLSALHSVPWAQWTELNDRSGEEQQNLTTALRCFEIHRLAASEALAMPDIQPVQLEAIDSTHQDLRSLSRSVIEVVHASRCFVSRTVRSLSFGQQIPFAEQQRRSHSQAVFRISSSITEFLKTTSETEPHAHLLRLQCICLSMFIELETLFAATETIYDDFATQFQTIIANAETIMELRRVDLQVNRPVFTLQLGIVQPLYYAAMKYRHSTWRRRAVSLLDVVGQEGPWRGSLLASIAQRCAMVEEGQNDFQAVNVPPVHSSSAIDGLRSWQNYLGARVPREPHSIAEAYRIMTCRVADDASVLEPPRNQDLLFTNTPRSMLESNIVFVQRRGNMTPLSIQALSTQDLIESQSPKWSAWTERIQFQFGPQHP